MNKRISLFLIVTLITLTFSALAALPSSPPPSPGGFEETPSEQVTAGDGNDIITSAQNSSVLTSLDARITALESKIEKLEQEKEQIGKNSGVFSTPFIILLSINLTLLGFMVYFFFLHKPAQE